MIFLGTLEEKDSQQLDIAARYEIQRSILISRSTLPRTAFLGIMRTGVGWSHCPNANQAYVVIQKHLLYSVVYFSA